MDIFTVEVAAGAFRPVAGESVLLDCARTFLALAAVGFIKLAPGARRAAAAAVGIATCSTRRVTSSARLGLSIRVRITSAASRTNGGLAHRNVAAAIKNWLFDSSTNGFF